MQRKCDLYWPSKVGSVHRYGLIEVAHVREDSMSTYTIRTFRMRHTRIRSASGSSKPRRERYIVQYQFTGWPDHGVPENPLPLLSFVRRSSDANRDTESPVLVHCSAGVGRTGAYVLIDAMLKQLKAKGEMNLIAYLKHIRGQRNYMVQTEEQYIFVHDALAEAVASGETNINRAYLSRYINSLQSSFTTDENSIPWQLLDRQFKLATAYRPQEHQFMAALNPCNQAKNQNFDYLPIESARVALTPKIGVEGSDYINASWLPGHSRLREYIITQHPLEQTVVDFWRMIWEHGVRTAVILSPVQQPEFGVFWPNQQLNIETDSIRVKLAEENEIGGYQTKDFALSSLHDESYQLTLRIVFCPGWPHLCSPLSTTTDLVGTVQNINDHRSPSSPVAVVDRFGGTEAAFFCAVSSLLRQLDFENHVDVYEYAKVSHARRPGIWRTQEEFFHLYRIMDSVCSVDGTSQYELCPTQMFSPADQAFCLNGMPAATSMTPLCPNAAASNGQHHQQHVLQSFVRISPEAAALMQNGGCSGAGDSNAPATYQIVQQQQQQQQSQRF